MIQDVLLERARRFDVPVIENTCLDDAIGQVLDLVLTGAEQARSRSRSPRPRLDVGRMVTENDVVEALHGVEDPELGMDIVEIGLFYEAQIDGPASRSSTRSPRWVPGRPDDPGEHPRCRRGAARRREVEVELTFEPPWTPDRMSDDAKFILGFG